MYQMYNARPVSNRPPYRRRGFKPGRLKYVVPLILLVYVTYALLRPVSTPHAVITPPVSPALVKVKIPWPKSSDKEQSAYGAAGYGLLAASSNVETAMPMASTAKVITALAVLQKKPLQAGVQGPAITLTAHDVALYNTYIAKDGSALPVTAGETISEYQALQAMLLPSANNIADTLAIWAFGSMPAYTNYANSYIKKLNMNATIVADASGFDPRSISTASDLVRLGNAALDTPVINEIINQKTAEFPGYGTITNTNGLLGQNGIRGIKTGNSDGAGGCFLAAADVTVGPEKVRVITAVLGAPDLGTAMRDSLPLIQSSQSQFQNTHVVRPNQTLGMVTTDWGAHSNIVSSNTIDTLTWTGTTLPPLIPKLHLTAPAKAGADIGQADLTYQGNTKTARLRLATALPGPSPWWRLTHPF